MFVVDFSENKYDELYQKILHEIGTITTPECLYLYEYAKNNTRGIIGKYDDVTQALYNISMASKVKHFNVNILSKHNGVFSIDNKTLTIDTEENFLIFLMRYL